MQKEAVFMVGMPESGKTTFLVALCRLLVLGDQETLWRLEQDDIPGGYKSIEKAVEKLDSYHVVDRTVESDLYEIQLLLLNAQQEEIQFEVPDFSGEIYRDLVYERHISRKILNKLESADTLLFFINTDTMVSEIRIPLQEKSAMKLLREDQDGVEAEMPMESEQHTEKNNNQSSLVELLQTVVYLVKGSLKIKVIISAWDLFENVQGQAMLLPEEHVKKELPLFYQYLMANGERFSVEFWGVSAQGGDFCSKEEKMKLQSSGAFPYVVDCKGERSNDLTKLL